MVLEGILNGSTITSTKTSTSTSYNCLINFVRLYDNSTILQ